MLYPIFQWMIISFPKNMAIFFGYRYPPLFRGTHFFFLNVFFGITNEHKTSQYLILALDSSLVLWDVLATGASLARTHGGLLTTPFDREKNDPELVGISNRPSYEDFALHSRVQKDPRVQTGSSWWISRKPRSCPFSRSHPKSSK